MISLRKNAHMDYPVSTVTAQFQIFYFSLHRDKIYSPKTHGWSFKTVKCYEILEAAQDKVT